MTSSGYVLAGGRSTRMGRDKASLPYAGATLIQHIASIVERAAGSVALIGDPDRYASLGYPVYCDLIRGSGPIGGLYTALSVTATDWNLIVACDMPGLSEEALRSLVARVGQTVGDCVIATGAEGAPQPLCAVYHRRCLPLVTRAIREKRFRMKDLVPELRAEAVPIDAAALANVNTPAEWVEFEPKPT